MGGSVLAALLIISIGEWGGDEALHWEAENSSVARISQHWENVAGTKTSQWRRKVP